MIRRPKNYLAPAERQRIFWRFMPLAVVIVLLLGWVERTWFRPPVLPEPPQIDTRLPGPLTDAAVPDAVLIEPEPQSVAEEDGRPLAASSESLSQVRDDTVFRSGDRDAWFEIWQTLRDRGPPPPSAVRRVSFSELYGQPRSFRGRAVGIAGTLHRLERVEAPVNDAGIDGYWQGWLEPEGGPASPVVVYFLDLPDGMPEGLSIDERVDVNGYFFKRWAYAAKDTVRTAPLVMAVAPRWMRRPDVRRSVDSITIAALASMVALVLFTLVGIRFAGRGPRRAEPPSADMEAALAGAEIVSTEESLRRLAATHLQEKPSP